MSCPCITRYHWGEWNQPMRPVRAWAPELGPADAARRQGERWPEARRPHLGRVPRMTRSIRRCPRCLGRDGEHYPECPIPVLATITERAETPDAPPQTETLFGDDE